ncbi:MAG: 3,4-dihydroxy-2-butanone-4-phosphate synthase [Bacteroidota bacterium]|nr:3,4-dihydroxy-2-butanone-4-phosphate synthase [Bacteroidota bacterium]
MLHTIEEAIVDIKQGKLIIVVDNEDRENEGDFICAAEAASPELINFMATQGRGLICAPIEENRAEELQLPLMVRTNTSLHETAFTVSVDLIGHGCSTGISTYDRARTIQALADEGFKSSDFAKPGHIFPLRAMKGGVLVRTGHTEATIDLARLAGCKPAGALVEILNDDGTMARLPHLLQKSKDWNLKVISISDLVKYRLQRERLVNLNKSFEKMTPFGAFQVHIYSQSNSNAIHVAFVKGDISPKTSTLVRVQYCDPYAELMDIIIHGDNSIIHKSLQSISQSTQSILLLISSTERPLNPLFRISEGLITDESSRHDQDQREIGIGSQILRELGVNKMVLLSNHPKKNIALQGYDLEIERYQTF